MQTNPNTAQVATNGSVLLQNANTSTGAISIGFGSLVKSAGTGGPVEITIGAPPTQPAAGGQPANVTVNPIGEFEQLIRPRMTACADQAVSVVPTVDH